MLVNGRQLVAVLINITEELSSLEGDHFLCWKTAVAEAPPNTPPFLQFTPVTKLKVADAISSSGPNDPCRLDVQTSKFLCNPANKNGESPRAPKHPGHLGAYTAVLSQTQQPQPPFVKQRRKIENQLGRFVLSLEDLDTLLVPTAKALGTDGAPGLTDGVPDHYHCYQATVAKARPGQPPFPTFTPVQVTVRDQLAGPLRLDLEGPKSFCAPANVAQEDPDAFDHAGHLVCYKAQLATTDPPQAKPAQQIVSLRNRFGDEVLVGEVDCPTLHSIDRGDG